VGKPEGRRPFGIPRYRWEYNSRMDIQEMVCGAMDCIELFQDRNRWWALVNVVMGLHFPQNVRNFLTS